MDFDTIYISKPSDSKKLQEYRARLLPHCNAIRQWLLRAGSCPLSISMDNNNTFQIYLRIISDFTPLLRRLEVVVSTTADAALLASIPSDRVPILEHLWVHFGFSTVEHNQWASCGVLNAPNLHSVRLSDFTSSITDIKANWKRITKLVLLDVSSFHKSSLEEALAIFSRCINLVHCTLAIQKSSAADIFFTYALRLPLPYLQYLSVNDHAGDTALSTLFSLIDAPRLHHVAYSTNLWPRPTRRSPLLALLTHNGTSVRYLTTDPARHFRLAEFLECILLTPFLEGFNAKVVLQPVTSLSESLTPAEKCSMNSVLSLLTPQVGDSESHVRWPHLMSLVCDAGQMADDTYVLAFLCGRMDAPADAREAGVRPMKKVHMRFSRKHQLDIPAALEDHVARGLELKLEYQKETPQTVPQGRFNPRMGISRESSYEKFSLS